MNIIIIGCGKIGSTLAEQLNAEGHKITVVDMNELTVNQLATKLDVLGVSGNGAIQQVQREAGIEHADVLIAVTGSDELNILCCLIAKKEGNVSTIARVRNPEYDSEIEYLKKQLGLSLVINPEKIVAHEISRLLRFPSAEEIETFANGTVDMIKLHLPKQCIIDGVSLKELPKATKSKVLVSLIEREQEVIIPSGETALKAGDLISIVARPTDAQEFCREIGAVSVPIRSAMIIGGGKIAHYLFQYMTTRRTRCDMKLIEVNPERCNYIAENFPKVTVIRGDGTNQQLLLEEGLEKTDAFLTLTGFDEQNIIMTLFASQLSDLHLLTKVNRFVPDEIPGGLHLGAVVCPRTATADAVVRYVRGLQNSMGSNVETLYKIANGKAEALEFTVKEDPKIVNIPLMKLKLKKNFLVAAIIRNSHVISPGGSDMFLPGDHAVIFTTEPGTDELRDILA